HSMASSYERHCQSQNPATSSLVSVNGPSTTVRLLPENLMRAPWELGFSPSAASRMPAFTSSSLYFPIAVSSSVLGNLPASLSALALSITRKRMGGGAGRLLDSLLPLPTRRMRGREIDSVGKILQDGV